MTNEELQKHKVEMLKNLEEIENEAGWLAEMCQFMAADLMEVKTVEEAREWQEKYSGVEEKLKHITLW